MPGDAAQTRRRGDERVHFQAASGLHRRRWGHWAPITCHLLSAMPPNDSPANEMLVKLVESSKSYSPIPLGRIRFCKCPRTQVLVLRVKGLVQVPPDKYLVTLRHEVHGSRTAAGGCETQKARCEIIYVAWAGNMGSRMGALI